MLWQSSLLIILALALDLAFRRKVRPGVRYAFWLIVALKLLLPPSLAFPTSLAWWLRHGAVARNLPPASQFIVTYGPASLPVSQQTVLPPAPPPLRLSMPAAALVAVGGVSLALLAWMLLRWRLVAREVRLSSSGTAPEWLEGLLDEARRLAGIRRRIRLCVVDRRMSPAIFGFFRPGILLPRSVVDSLSPAQMRSVLLHELIHLRRGDVWVNCAQALVQIVYWWHPLVWLANSRIRRAREEAVDEAVMLALAEDAEEYPVTLLEVARLALPQPLASLGLLGILESHNCLRSRIERLMDFHPPRRKRITVISTLCLLAFGAVALPMGKAPAPGISSLKAVATADAAKGPIAVRVFQLDTNVLASIRRGAGRGSRPASAASSQPDVFRRLGITLPPTATYFYNPANGTLLVRATASDLNGLEDAMRRASVLSSGQSLGLRVAESLAARAAANGPDWLASPSTPDDERPARALIASRSVTASPPPASPSTPQQAGVPQPLATRVIRVDYDAFFQAIFNTMEVPPNAAAKEKAVAFGEFFSAMGIDITPPNTIFVSTAGGGHIFFRGTPHDVERLQRLVATLNVGRSPANTGPAPAESGEAAHASPAVQPARQPNNGSSGPHGRGVHVRIIRVDPRAFLYGLHSVMRFPKSANAADACNAFKAYLSTLQVDLAPSETIAFNQREGLLRVRAAPEHLEMIERVIHVLATAPPQVDIKANFIEVSEADATRFWGKYFTRTIPGHPGAAQLSTDESKRQWALWTAKQQGRKPSLFNVTTLSGRQLEMFTVDALKSPQPIGGVAHLDVRGYYLTPPFYRPPAHGGRANPTPASEADKPATIPIRIGSDLKLVPTVSTDERSVSLSGIATMTELPGHGVGAESAEPSHGGGAGKNMTESASEARGAPGPVLRIRRIFIQGISVRDGDTLVLGYPLDEQGNPAEAPGDGQRRLLVLITPTVIDRAGNPIHRVRQ